MLPSAPWICFIAELSYGRKGQNVMGERDTFHRCSPARSVSPPRTAAVLAAGSRRRAFAFLVTVRPSEFLAAVGDAAGSSRDCGCSILLLLIELSGLPVAIKVVSAIVEVSRPAIEAAVGFRRRGMVLVTPLVYGFNFRALSFQEPDGEALRRVILRLVYMLLY
ncbi:uncharacterized protein LOC130946834 isoform X5 [Arachis stenosperma]|uniref:uncharacterized protein LOC130946834 isoform X5 n=1 Tax=Arachis stenosperma TaxID=217475 RepID=UPI0025AC7AA7|nr:uncharacterized protein LOC130946834 isoform X5 [Arachis stenosperma]